MFNHSFYLHLNNHKFDKKQKSYFLLTNNNHLPNYFVEFFSLVTTLYSDANIQFLMPKSKIKFYSFSGIRILFSQK